MKIYSLICKAILLTGALVVLASCKSDDTPGGGNFEQAKQDFLTRTEIGVYDKGAATYVLDKATDQIYVSKAKKTFRLQQDDLSKMVQIVLGGEPEEGATTTCDAKFSNVAGMSNATYNVSLIHSDGDFRWLWDGSKGIGFLILWK